MKFFTASKRNILSSTIAGLLSISFIIAPISHTFETQRVFAQDAVVVIGGNGTVQESITAASSVSSKISSWIQTGLMSSLNIKEFTLDAIAWGLINIVIKEMIRSVTKWVNSGFKGSPAFVTNLNGYLTNIADKVAGNFIWGTPLNFLCSPFKLNIRLALDIQYKQTKGYVAQCRVSSVVKNMDRFLGGDFLAGGWDGWYSVALTPSNNPYGAMNEARNGLYAGIAGAQNIKLKELDFGNGFLSVEQCPEDGDFGACTTVTPGIVIQEQLNNTLDVTNKRLAVADEINELVGALFSQLGKQALGGVGGLLGLTEPRYGAGNYFDRMAAEASTFGYVGTSNITFESSIAAETKYRDHQQTIVTLITDASTYKERTYPAPEETAEEEGASDGVDRRTTSRARRPVCTAGALTSSLAGKRTVAQREIVSSTALIGTLNIFMNDYALLRNPATPATTLATLITKYGASSVPDAEGKLMAQFLSYQSSGALHTEESNVTLQLSTIPDLKSEIQSFTDSIDTACNPERD